MYHQVRVKSIIYVLVFSFVLQFLFFSMGLSISTSTSRMYYYDKIHYDLYDECIKNKDIPVNVCKRNDSEEIYKYYRKSSRDKNFNTKIKHYE